MKDATRQRLLQLNRDFYDTVAEPFDETRRGWTPGKRRLLDYLPSINCQSSVHVADIGCGNGRFAFMLESQKANCQYKGVDGNAQLLALAVQRATKLQHVAATFVMADLADEEWRTKAGMITTYDLVVCLATLQHMPGHELRCRLMCDLASLLKPGGLLAVSAWQFLTSERFRRRRIEWSKAGLTEDAVELGDALLPWKQNTYAVRYVHQIDEVEMNRLATQADLKIVETYRADGREGNLNLYAIMTNCHCDQ